MPSSILLITPLTALGSFEIIMTSPHPLPATLVRIEPCAGHWIMALDFGGRIACHDYATQAEAAAAFANLIARGLGPPLYQ